jgi:hypothetical protein
MLEHYHARCVGVRYVPSPQPANDQEAHLQCCLGWTKCAASMCTVVVTTRSEIQQLVPTVYTFHRASREESVGLKECWPVPFELKQNSVTAVCKKQFADEYESTVCPVSELWPRYQPAASDTRGQLCMAQSLFSVSTPLGVQVRGSNVCLLALAMVSIMSPLMLRGSYKAL